MTKQTPSGASPSGHRLGRAASLALSFNGWLVAVAGAASRFPLPEVALVATAALIAALPLCRNALPIGYGGFFVQMAEQINAHGFSLPHEVAYYGPGGTPFAYPPLGLYLMALAIGPLAVPAMSYVRWFPVLASVALTVTVYALGLRLSGSRWVAIVATALVMTNLTILGYHTTTAGVVRGPALVFAVTGLWTGLGALSAPRPLRAALVTAGLFALTILCHLSYAVFFAVSLTTFVLVGGVASTAPWRRRLVVAATVLCGGVIFAAPWWLTVVRQWGTAPFTSAASSHGGFGLTTSMATYGARVPFHALDLLIGSLDNWSPAVVPGLAFAGLGLLLARRQWLIPAWAAVAFFGVGESERYLVLVGGIAAAMLLVSLGGCDSSVGPVRSPLFAGLPAALIVGICLLTVSYSRYKVVGALSPALLETATFLREQTPPDSHYLELTASHDAGEWLPYLARRTPAIAPWGSEWNGRGGRQVRLYQALLAGAREQQPDLIERLCDQPEGRVDYLVIPVSSQSLIRHFEQAGRPELYRNEAFVVVRLPAPDAATAPGLTAPIEGL